jgi:hypothetical protein
MDANKIIENVKNLHHNIAGDVWPDGWVGECHICGKPFYYTQEEFGYCLAHGWPKCDHNISNSNV